MVERQRLELELKLLKWRLSGVVIVELEVTGLDNKDMLYGDQVVRDARHANLMRRSHVFTRYRSVEENTHPMTDGV